MGARSSGAGVTRVVSPRSKVFPATLRVLKGTAMLGSSSKLPVVITVPETSGMRISFLCEHSVPAVQYRHSAEASARLPNRLVQ